MSMDGFSWERAVAILSLRAPLSGSFPSASVLDLQRLHQQFGDFQAYQTDARAYRADQLGWALDALEACAFRWQEMEGLVEQKQPEWLVPTLRDVPDACYDGGERPTPLTVVATDGSQVFPDRHLEPTCYLLNVSRVAFHYGTTEPPILEAEPFFHYRREELEELYGHVLESATTELVSALRDELELEHLLQVARRARRPGRPVVAVADGTLIRWMLRGMNDRDAEERLIASYLALLGQFREEEIPLFSYVSLPRNTEVVGLLRVVRGECDEPPPEETLAGLLDRFVFERVLEPGGRSSVFESSSKIQERYGAADRICYFYVHIPSATGPGEIGHLDLIHAAVLSECRKGDGYPMILSEAHEHAVIRAAEKEVFYRLIERQMQGAGLPLATSRKRRSKQAPRV